MGDLRRRAGGRCVQRRLGGGSGALDRHVALDGDGELGELGVADDAPELSLGFEHAGAVQRRHMSPLDQCLTLRAMRRTVSIIDSHGFVEASVRLSRPRTPSRVTVSVSCMPSRSDAAAPGCERASSSASSRSWSSARA